MDRLQLLQEYYDQDPNDPFNLYGLALEYQKYNLKKSKELYDVLLGKFPEYLAAYYMTAKLCEELELEQDAIKIYEKGILVAQKQDNKKIENELKVALTNLEMEML